MISLLMEEDKHPGFLDKKVRYVSLSGYNENVPTLEKGKFYTIRELIQSMVSRSDNIAYDLCWQMIEPSNFAKLFKDLNIKPYDIYHPSEYSLSAPEYSKFFRALYNAGFVSKKMSDFALRMLAESDFNLGLVKNMTDSFTVARKFGIRIGNSGTHLSEFGIFYFDNDPYFLGVITKKPIDRKSTRLNSSHRT